ncbi:hypothetical protein JTE90_010292 [Oedothorax gibbosus]|uniref:Uncharacterized protein n=1 Tax=Oedothorax gibbosus TaxID=931172 RepID=A0AAV6V391_9ARAC|nr:hypothetical protein JTE90_010292 [Oedothorax gibbosus]
MGTCFGSCSKKLMRKTNCKRKFVLIRTSQEHNDDEEFLEMEQRNVATIESPQRSCPEVYETNKPSKISFPSKKGNFTWLRNENQMISGALHHIRNMKSPADSVMPLLNRESSYAETISNSGSHKWDQLSRGATPNSSVDLEWENEIGFNSSNNLGAMEEPQWTVLTENTNTNNSHRSSPLSNSNGLEWDGDFTR